jgi:hypothetical protein
VLEFYEFGVILKKPRLDGATAYPVDPMEIAELLSENFKQLVEQQKERDPLTETGLIGSDTLYVARSARRSIVIGYREPQITGLFFEGSEEAYRVPLPGLILIRTVKKGQPSYGCFAVKRRPVDLSEPLYLPPLPHMNNGSVCWGTVPKPSEEAMASTASLKEDFKFLLGSRFGSHAVARVSKSHPKDVRPKFAELEQRKAKRYPVNDLIEAKQTFGNLLERLR